MRGLAADGAGGRLRTLAGVLIGVGFLTVALRRGSPAVFGDEWGAGALFLTAAIPCALLLGLGLIARRAGARRRLERRLRRLRPRPAAGYASRAGRLARRAGRFRQLAERRLDLPPDRGRGHLRRRPGRRCVSRCSDRLAVPDRELAGAVGRAAQRRPRRRPRDAAGSLVLVGLTAPGARVRRQRGRFRGRRRAVHPRW